MQAADGVVKLWKEAGNSKLHARFNFAGRSPMHFIGHFNPPVEEFECHHATLLCTNWDALTASHRFYGKIGTNTIFLAIEGTTGLTIEGQLPHQLSPATRVVGFGSWFENITEDLRSVAYLASPKLDL